MQIAPKSHNNPPEEIDIVRTKLDETEIELRQAIASVEKTPLPMVIEDDKTAGEVTERIKDYMNIGKDVTHHHKTIKAPYLECGKAVDGWKNKMEAELDILRKKASVPLNTFLTKKAEDERQRQLAIAAKEREDALKLANEAAAHEAAKIHDVAGELLDEAIKSEKTAERIELNIQDARSSDLAKSRGAYGSTSSQKTAYVGRIKSLSGVDLEKLRPYFNEETIQKALNAFVKNGGRECAGTDIKEEITGLNIR